MSYETCCTHMERSSVAKQPAPQAGRQANGWHQSRVPPKQAGRRRTCEEKMEKNKPVTKAGRKVYKWRCNLCLENTSLAAGRLEGRRNHTGGTHQSPAAKQAPTPKAAR